MDWLRHLWQFHVLRKYWMTIEPFDDEVHIVPNRDLMQHEALDCPCGTTTEAKFHKDGSNGWIVTHFALDGRDATERARAHVGH